MRGDFNAKPQSRKAAKPQRLGGQAPTGVEVLENRVATKIPLLSAFASVDGATAPKRPVAL
jgi:hypothetical protein